MFLQAKIQKQMFTRSLETLKIIKWGIADVFLGQHATRKTRVLFKQIKLQKLRYNRDI